MRAEVFIHLPTWLGDAVMAGPAIYALREAFAGARIIFYGSSAALGLFKDFENCHCLIEDRRSLLTRLAQALTLRKKYHFTLALSFKSSPAARLILFLLRAQKRATYPSAQPEGLHQVRRYLEFTRSVVGGGEPDERLRLPIKIKRPSPLIFKNGKALLALAPGAAYGPAKRWPAPYFAELGLALAGSHELVILGSGEAEREACEEIEKILRSAGVRAKNLHNKTSIPRLAATLARTSLLIANDSGIMHLAAVYETPCVVVVGPSKFEHVAPRYAGLRVVSLALPCAPCARRVCPLGHHACMVELKAGAVLSQAVAILKAQQEKPVSPHPPLL